MALTDEGLIEQPGVLSRYVRLANGAQAHYVTAGESGPPLVLLHGGIEGSSGQAGFRFMIPFLAEHGFRVYAPDRPGFGLSDTRAEYWPTRGFVSWAQFVKDFADALCLDQFFLSGNSNGAQTCQHDRDCPAGQGCVEGTCQDLPCGGCQPDEACAHHGDVA